MIARQVLTQSQFTHSNKSKICLSLCAQVCMSEKSSCNQTEADSSLSFQRSHFFLRNLWHHQSSLSTCDLEMSGRAPGACSQTPSLKTACTQSPHAEPLSRAQEALLSKTFTSPSVLWETLIICYSDSCRILSSWFLWTSLHLSAPEYQHAAHAAPQRCYLSLLFSSWMV